MNWTAWLLLATTIVFFSFALFLGREIFKKFRFLDRFMSQQGYIQRVSFHWPGSTNKDMQNIVLEADCPFKILVGFSLKIPLIFKGTDWFGVGSSRRDRGTDRAVISTFLWKKPVEFRFLINSMNPEIHIRIVPPNFTVAHLEPDVICPPHFYQRLGFYA